MIPRTVETSPIIRARVTAFLVLVLTPVAIFGLMYIPSILIVRGDPPATANNIIASESLFRFGIMIALLIQVIQILWVIVLYQLLKSVNRNIASLMVILLLLGTPIAMLNELNHMAVLRLLSGADYLAVFPADQLHALISLFLNLYSDGHKIAGIFWGIWLFPYGYLVFKSGFLPRILGILLVIGGLSYVIQSLAAFLSPELAVRIALLPVLTSWGELLVPVWLVIKGVNAEKWERRAAVFA